MIRRWIPVLALLVCACAMPSQRSADPAAANGSVAPAPPRVCEPEPYCNADCLRGYQPGYCRFKCGC